ncbi:FRG domain-containing protein [Providencia rettgeri]|uniref:FRG domain-containing protein n=1 Tax=Providencia rettgeri TaxID=587 RepID=UPI001C22B245|nr:FRG domain-containing protein [Providencia rettgeri]QXB91601.1 FRG domain-containing protein [Providencia rettgeri]
MSATRLAEKNFFKVETINTIEEVINRFILDTNNYLYRGQRDHNWHLIPSLHRADDGVKNFLPKELKRKIIKGDRKVFIDIEMELVKKFIDNAHSISLRLPYKSMSILSDLKIKEQGLIDSWPSDECIEILSLMQHNKMPTSLLDWTMNPFVGLYFACKEHVQVNRSSKRFSLWQFDFLKFESIKEKLYKLKLKYKPDMIPPPINLIIEKIDSIKLYTSDSEINKNLSAQKGSFIYINYNGINENVSIDGFFNIIINEINELRNNPITTVENFLESDEDKRHDEVSNKFLEVFNQFSGVLIKFNINGRLASEIVKIATKLGYSELSLFPSYESCVNEVRITNSVIKREKNMSRIGKPR